MNKSELVDKIAAGAGLTKAQATDSLKATLDAIEGALIAKEAVALIGFGTFSTQDKPERQGRNPSTGKPMTIKAKTVAKFKPGKALAEAVNK